MKIKEKGLTGKGANHRRELLSSQKFDAFREMAKDKGTSKKKAVEDKDVFLEFLGQKILIKKDGEGQGVVDEKDIPFVKGVTLKFDGCGGDVTWSEIKVKTFPVFSFFLFRTLLTLFFSIQDPIRERFDGRAPYIKYTRGEDSGLVGFYKPLSEEDIEFVKSTIKTINNNEVTWSSPKG
jgi:lupus La protein